MHMLANLEEFNQAEKALRSATNKSQKVLHTLEAKLPDGHAQIHKAKMTHDALDCAYTLVITGFVASPDFGFDAKELTLMVEILEVFIAQIEAIAPRFHLGSPQATLAARRLAAFRLAITLARQNLDSSLPSVPAAACA